MRLRSPFTRPFEPLKGIWVVVGGIVAISEVVRNIAKYSLFHWLLPESYLVDLLVESNRLFYIAKALGEAGLMRIDRGLQVILLGTFLECLHCNDIDVA